MHERRPGRGPHQPPERRRPAGAPVVSPDADLPAAVARRLLDASPDGSVWWRPEGRFGYVSPACEALTGHAPAAFLANARLALRLVHPDDRAALLTHLRAPRGATTRFRLRIVDRGGRLRWVELASSPMRGDAGEDLGVFVTNRDVSEVVAQELATGASAQQWAATPAVAFTWRVEPGWPVEQVSDGVRLWGYEPATFQEDGFAYADLIHPDDLPDVAAEVDRYLEGGADAYRQRYRLRLGDGAFHWVDDMSYALRDADGGVVRVRGVVTVVDEAVRVERALAESESELRRAHLVAGLGSWHFDLATRTFRCSPEVLEMYGLRPSPVITYEAFRPSFHPEDAATVDEAWAAALLGEGYDLEYRVVVGGRERWLQEVVAAEGEPGGLAGALIGTVRDVTERRARDDLLRRQAVALEQSPNIVMLTDTEGRIEYVNRRFEEVSGFRREEVVGRRTNTLGSGAIDGQEYADLWRTIRAGDVWRGQFHNRRAGGGAYWERAVIAPVRDGRGVITHFVKLADDETAEREMRERLEYLAFHDALTGLPNRALFLDRVAQALWPTPRGDQGVAVLLAGVRGMNAVNEAWGHEAGDQVLLGVAERLRATVRAGDTVARVAGDEFAVLLRSIAAVEDAGIVARKLHDALKAPLVIGGRPAFVHLGIGVAVAPADGRDADTLLQRAAAALRQAKDAGVRQTRFFTVDLDRMARERFELEAALRGALARHEVSLVYQPRFALADGRLAGFEALARWTDPRFGAIPPSRFVPLAEETGLIGHLGAEVMAMALRQLRSWSDAGLPVVPVSVNLSASEFARADVVERIEAALAAARVPSSWLEVELTESVAVVDVARTVATVTRLRDLGVAVSIDDFGAGHSTFQVLARLPVAALKIDRSFVHDLADDPAARPQEAAIVAAIIGLAHTLGLRVVAEGIEGPAQQEFLVRHGCDYGQGFLLGRPVPADEAATWFGRTAAAPS